VRQERPSFDWRDYGFQEFSELLNYAQDKSLVRIQADEDRGLIVYLGAEFHPPAPPPEPEPTPLAEEEEEYEPQPIVPGQPTATGEIPVPAHEPKPARRPRRKPAAEGGVAKKRAPRPRKKQPVA
jgi:outer membrane biosynthesis protein TonB